MPRKAPKEVVEHRLTLGDYERKVLTKQLAEDDLLNKAATGAQIGKTVAITGAVVGGTIAAGTIGMLAVSAYREANNLVEGAQDLTAGVWTTLKWRMGLISFDDYLGEVGDISTETEEEKAERERRENMGFLEWGLDNVLTFLFGKDKKWTRTQNVTEEEADSMYFHELLEGTKDYEEVVKATEAVWGSMENYQRIANEYEEWLHRISLYCDGGLIGDTPNPNFDRELCEETQQDYNEWKKRIIAQYGKLP